MMLRGLSRKVAIKNIEKLVNKFEINKKILNKKYMLLSSGQKKQISILRCLGHSPQLAILDEPFDNIDKSFKLKLEDFISQESKKNAMAFVIASHVNRNQIKFTQSILISSNQTYKKKNEI